MLFLFITENYYQPYDFFEQYLTNLKLFCNLFPVYDSIFVSRKFTIEKTMNEDNKKEKFLDLLEPLLDKLYMYARMLEKNPQDAEDLVSETILTCYESFAQIRDENSFKAYIFKVMRNKFRRKNRRAWLFGSYDEEKALRIPSTEPQQDLSLDVEILYKVIEKLPIKQKEAVVLFEISGFSLNEIKVVQGATLSAVKSRIKRGREKLTEMLNPKSATNEMQHNNIETNKILLKV